MSSRHAQTINICLINIWEPSSSNKYILFMLVAKLPESQNCYPTMEKDILSTVMVLKRISHAYLKKFIFANLNCCHSLIGTCLYKSTVPPFSYAQERIVIADTLSCLPCCDVSPIWVLGNTSIVFFTSLLMASKSAMTLTFLSAFLIFFWKSCWLQ